MLRHIQQWLVAHHSYYSTAASHCYHNQGASALQSYHDFTTFLFLLFHNSKLTKS